MGNKVRATQENKRKREQEDDEEEENVDIEEDEDDDDDVSDDSSNDGVEEDDEKEDLNLEAEAGAEEVEAELGFFDPQESDFPAIEQLLINAGQKAYGPLPVADLATMICKQQRVGTVVRVGEESEAIAFISCLSIDANENLRVLRSLLYRNVANQDLDILKKCYPKHTESSLGFLVSERVVNFPPELIPKLQEAIFDEITWAQEDEPTEELCKSFKFENYVYFTTCLMSSVGTSTKAKQRKKQKRKKLKKRKNEIPEAETTFEFFRVDDEVIFKNSILTLSFPLPGHKPVKGGLIMRRIALVFPATAVPNIRSECIKLLQDKES